MAEYLLGLGSDPHWHPDHNDRLPVQIAASGGTRRDLLVEWLDAGIGPCGDTS